jgi:hypothetical protein
LRRVVAGGLVAGLMGLALAPATVGGTSAIPGDNQRIRADLDGAKEIRPADISRFYCHDFDFPEIHCFSTPELLEAASGGGQEMLMAGVTYVTIYEHTSYAGSYMHVSENYDTLFWVGWNDRVSSFKAKNSQSGSFHTDWYGGGAPYSFCCNQTVASLGSYNDTFTSVYND